MLSNIYKPVKVLKKPIEYRHYMIVFYIVYSDLSVIKGKEVDHTIKEIG